MWYPTCTYNIQCNFYFVPTTPDEKKSLLIH
jgi:hypothetical protein